MQWRFRARDIIEVSPAVAPDGTVIAGTNDAFEYGLGPDGSVRWRYPRNALSYSSPGVSEDGLAFFGDHLGFLNVVSVNDGDLVARFQGRARTARVRSVGVWTSPAIDVHHNVYFGTRPGHIYGFAFDGRRLFDIDTGGTVDSYPAITADGTLIAGSESGVLYAIRD